MQHKSGLHSGDKLRQRFKLPGRIVDVIGVHSHQPIC